MKMKLLDTALIGILAGMASTALAQEETSVPAATVTDATGMPGAGQPATPAAAAGEALDCGAEGCVSDEGLVFKLRTRSYDRPVTEGTTAQSPSEALQPD
ncbi:hypothetical protein QFW77_05300, partial [Luteimonas sp. RD2P54]